MDRQNRRNSGATRTVSHQPEHRRRRNRSCCCGCDFYQPEWMQHSNHALAVANCNVCHGSGEPICFTDGCRGDAIALYTPGIYYAVYTLHMPDHQPVHTQLQLALDDQLLPESHTCIDHDGDHPAHVTGQAMFEICHPTCLRLITRCPLNLQACCEEPLITLAVFRIC